MSLLQALKTYRFIPKLRMKLAGGVVHLTPAGKPSRGNVLISYTTLPFVGRKSVLGGHTNQWECQKIAQTFLDLGYHVDVIDTLNKKFLPRKTYRYFLDVHYNMERLAPLLPSSCIKILHTTTSYWEFQNKAEEKRLDDIKQRRGVTLLPRRLLPSSRAYEVADVVAMLGNDVTEASYPRLGKRIVRIPVSSTHFFNTPVAKDFGEARTHFMWLGGVGMVHKGLDLVLEAFASTPELSLSICGKVENEKDFVEAYRKELYETPNIKVYGLVDPGSELFEKLRQTSIALIYPSCSEGQAGSVIVSMHAGLIPIVSKESGVTVAPFGLTLGQSTVKEIIRALREVALMEPAELKRRALDAWTYANAHHTRKTFSDALRAFVADLEKSKP
jgi:glycosyltransferase involved in cell wall biosynthesis